jgi:hypothetical protein
LLPQQPQPHPWPGCSAAGFFHGKQDVSSGNAGDLGYILACSVRCASVE